MQDIIKPVLIFTWGNPSRGDDALGPRMYELLEDEAFDDIDILTDFQLQIEHTIDMKNRDTILFVDASVSAPAPFDFYRLQPVQDDSYTTHAMSPESLLSVYEKTTGQTPPPSFLLAIRGYAFDLGLPVSEKALSNLTQALAFIRQLTNASGAVDWDTLASNRKRADAP
jgi:hydrogenase maturation protease